MTGPRPSGWFAAAVASAGLHLAAIPAASLMLRPEPPPAQTIPKPQVEVAAHPVPRAEATGRTPQGEASAERGTTGTAAQSWAPPQNRVEALAETPAAAPGIALDTEVLASPVTGTSEALPSLDGAQNIQSRAPPNDAQKSIALAPKKAGAAPASDERIASDLSPGRSGLVASGLDADPVSAEPPASQSLSASQAIDSASLPSPVNPTMLEAAPTSASQLVSTAPETVGVVAGAIPSKEAIASKQGAEVARAAPSGASELVSSIPKAVSLTAEAIATEDARDTTGETVSLSTSTSGGQPVRADPVSGVQARSEDVAGPGVAASPPKNEVAALADLPQVPAVGQTAWSGPTGAAVDATSIAAAQAFSVSGQQSHAPVRDAISGAVGSVPCSRIQAVFDAQTGRVELRGHVPTAEAEQPALVRMQSLVGTSIDVVPRLRILPKPQCNALTRFARIGLPQSTEQFDNPAIIGEQGFVRAETFQDGDVLEIPMQAPDYPSIIYVDYFSADGRVVHIQPNEIVPARIYDPKTEFVIGDQRGAGPALELRIAPPFGQEIVIAYAASTALFDAAARPLVEDAEEYLRFLERRIGAAKAAEPSFKGEWVYFFVTTAPR